MLYWLSKALGFGIVMRDSKLKGGSADKKCGGQTRSDT